MSLIFERVDEIFKEYGLIGQKVSGGRTEYDFPDGKSIIRRKILPLLNGGVRGYVYVGFLEEYKFKDKAPLDYKYVNTARGHIKYNDMSEQELLTLLDRVVEAL